MKPNTGARALLTIVSLLALSACAVAPSSGEDAEDVESAEEAITSDRAMTLFRRSRTMRVRRVQGSVGWELPVAKANALSDAEVLATNTSVESGRFDVSAAKLTEVRQERPRACSDDGACMETLTLFKHGDRHYVRSAVSVRWQPRSMTEEWFLVLDLAAARWVTSTLRPAEKLDGTRHIYLPVAQKFLDHPDSIPEGTRPFLVKVAVPGGTMVRAFGALFFLETSGKAWEIQVARECAGTRVFDGDRCAS